MRKKVQELEKTFEMIKKKMNQKRLLSLSSLFLFDNCVLFPRLRQEAEFGFLSILCYWPRTIINAERCTSAPPELGTSERGKTKYRISSYNCRGNYSFLNSSSEETIQGEETIQEMKLYEEIRHLKFKGNFTNSPYNRDLRV